jgi:hypothetical protein
MAAPSPARLYAALAGAVLFAGGIAGFFFDLSWVNFLHLATGAVALLLAGAAPRPCALALGLLYTGVAVWGFTGGEDWLQWPQLAIGLLGLAAAAGTAKPSRGSKPTKDVRKEPRRKKGSEARAQAAAEGA